MPELSRRSRQGQVLRLRGVRLGLPRPGLPREEDFGSRLRGPAVAARAGLWLGVCFGLAFLTGVYSHLAQEPVPPVTLPVRPAWLYRVTQGVHVAAGTAAVPLLLVKLWSVYPRLFARPPRLRRDLLLHLLERASIGALVAASIFQLATGLANAAQWYPWSFSFRSTHYAVGWIAVGALLVHVAVKLPAATHALRGDLDDPDLDPVPHPAAGRPDGQRDEQRDEQSGGAAAARAAGAASQALTRRSLLRATWAAAGLAVLTTAGSAVPLLRSVSVFGVRSGEGPGGVPVNRTARQAGVTAAARSEGYRLAVTGPRGSVRLDLAELEALPQHAALLPIACVEGWSAVGRWTGVRVRDLVALVGGEPDAPVRVGSLQRTGAFRRSRLPGSFTADDETLLALRLAGEPLSLDHGYPCRLIAPNRPGVLQTKWVSALEVKT